MSSFLIKILFLLLPLLYFPNIYNSYELPKFAFFITLVIFITFISIYNLSKVWGRPPPNLTNLLVLSFLFVNFLANLTGLDPKISLLGSKYRHQGFLTLTIGVLLYLSLYSLPNRKKALTGVTKSIMAGSLLVSLIAVWQYVEFNFLYNFNIPTYNGRIVATLGNPNFLAGYLAITLPLILSFNLNLDKKTHMRNFVNIMVKIGIIGLTLTAIFITKSRGAILAASVVFLLQLIKTFKYKSLLIIALIAYFLTNFAPAKIVKRTSIWDNRKIIWEQGLIAVKKSPFLGYGQENFELAIQQNLQMKTDNAHNIFLETAVSSGLIGLFIFLAILVYALKKAPFVIKLALAAFLIRAQFNPLSIAEIALFWFLLSYS